MTKGLLSGSDPTLDFIKRHSAWIGLVILAFIIGFMIIQQINDTDAAIDNIIMTADDDKAYSDIQALESDKKVITPFLAYIFASVGIMLCVPLASIVLYSFTKVPFLKYILKGDNDKLDGWERRWLYLVAIGVWIGCTFIMGCAIIVMKLL